MNKKGAIGLSMNVLVIIIISIVILVGGISLLFKYVDFGLDTYEDLQEKIREQLESMIIDQGKQVSIAFHSATVYPGDNHLFGIGILNIKSENDFNLEIKLSKVYDEEEKDITSQLSDEEINNWIFYNKDLIKLKENEHSIEYVLINIPKDATKGSYIFDGKVFSNGEQYGNTQKIYVTVK